MLSRWIVAACAVLPGGTALERVGGADRFLVGVVFAVLVPLAVVCRVAGWFAAAGAVVAVAVVAVAALALNRGAERVVPAAERRAR